MTEPGIEDSAIFGGNPAEILLEEGRHIREEMVCEYIELSSTDDPDGAIDQVFCVMMEVLSQVKM